jgi:hypothetical protein
MVLCIKILWFYALKLFMLAYHISSRKKKPNLNVEYLYPGVLSENHSLTNNSVMLVLIQNTARNLNTNTNMFFEETRT